MSVLEDCESFLTVTGAGTAVFRYRPAAVEIDAKLAAVIGQATVPGRTTTIFVSTADIDRPQLRNYLHGELDKGLHLTVTVFDHEDFTPVRDLDRLDDAVNTLGVEVNLPAGMEDRSNSIGDENAGPRLVPPPTIRQRTALHILADDPSEPSLAKLTRYVASGPPGLDGDQRWMADHSAQLGVLIALFGAKPEYDLSALASSAPVTIAGLAHAVRGSFTSVELPAIVHEIESGRAGAALVHGLSVGATDPEMRWLVRGENGKPHWLERDGSLSELNRFGADDPRTRLLEQPETTVLTLSPAGVAYVPEPPPTPVFDHPPGRLHMEVTTLGRPPIFVGPSWGDEGFRSPEQNEILELAERYEGPGSPVVVNVRRVPVGGLSGLDSRDAAHLNSVLWNDEIPVVLATESNHQVEWLTELRRPTQRFLPSLVHPVADGFAKLWDVRAPGGQRDQFSEPTPELMSRAMSLAQPVPDTLMPEVRILVASKTWVEAAQYFQDHIDKVRTPEAAEQVVRMAEQYNAHSLSPDWLSGGTIKDSPFFVPDVALPAFGTLLTTAVKAADDPARAGRAPIEPQNAWITETITLNNQIADERLPLGFLTNRQVPVTAEVDAYMRALLWRKTLVVASLIAATGLKPHDGLAVAKAEGELPGELAARSAQQTKISRAHAVIYENLLGILFPDSAMGDVASREKLLNAIVCLSGLDRVAWVYIVKNQVKPFWPTKGGELDKLIDIVVTCQH